uniref:Uncharacterized protein n=1 Tax=Accipiter nisus TaxID=211598 RepID=A0A8B9RSM1_9AVES
MRVAWRWVLGKQVCEGNDSCVESPGFCSNLKFSLSVQLHSPFCLSLLSLFISSLSRFLSLPFRHVLSSSFHTDELNLWCQRCIVVGSIYGQRFGKMIDSYHVIIRLNDRTSTRLFFPESALPNTLENNDDDELMVFVPFKPLDFSWLMEYNGNISQLHTLNPYVTYEAMYKLLQLNTSSRRYATTGITALNLALHMCQEVNIAGFGYPCNHDNTTPIHYYNMDHSLKKDLCQHNIAAERSWLLEMIEWGMTADIASPSFQAQTAERGLCCLLSPPDTTDDPSWALPLFQVVLSRSQFVLSHVGWEMNP